MKLVLKIFNLVYIVLAAVACVALLTKPLVAINADVNVPKEQVTQFLLPNLEDQGVTEEDLNQALTPSLNEKGMFNLKLDVNVPAASLFIKDSKQITEDLTKQISDSVDDLVNRLNPTIKELAKIIAKKEGGKAIKESIADQIKITNPEGDTAAIMEQAGITDDYIEDMTGTVLDALLGTPTEEPVKNVGELMDKIDNNIDDICGKLAAAGVEGYPTDPVERQEKVDAMKGDIEEQLQTALQEAQLCDDKGEIKNIDVAIEDLLVSLLDQLMGSETSEEPTKALILRADDGAEQESKLNAKIREFLNKKIEEFNIKGIVEQYWFVPAIFAGVLMLPWIIFILITAIRTLRKKCWTKSWVIFTFAIIQVVLGVVLYLITTKFIGQMLEIIPLPENPAIEIIKNSTLGIQTCTFIPSIIYLAMIPLTIVYMILAHKVKRDYKEEKRAKKNKMPA